MEQNTLIEEDVRSIYSLNRVMLHNSARSTIVSLDVNVNTYIVSGNGEGKTATMNAVQIGFLPWNNFVDSKRKFHFIDSRGNPYSDEQSYEFYFPKENSFMLFEFTNPHQTFTQIVYQNADNLGISRAFIPLAIDDIYDWFWEFDKDKEIDELGYPSRISLAGLKEKIKGVKGVEYARKVADAKRIMYNGNLTQKEGQYSIAHIDNRNVDNLVDIFRLTAKASSISDEKIKALTISLINNSYIDNKRDKLKIKPQELLSAFEELKRESDALTVRENARGTFEEVTASYHSLSKTSSELTALSNTVYQSAKAVASKEATLITQCQNRAQHIQNKITKEQESEKQLASQISDLGGQIRTHEDYARSMRADMNHYEWLRRGTVPGRQAGGHSRYQEKSDTCMFETDEEVVEILQEDKAEKKKELDILKNTESQHVEFTRAQRKMSHLKNEIINKRSRIERIQDQTGIHTCEAINSPKVLVALNNAFDSVGNEVLEKHADVLNAFSAIFTEEKGDLILRGDADNVPFGRVQDSMESVEDLEREIQELEANFNSYKKTRDNIAAMLASQTPLQTREKVAKYEEELELIDADLKVISMIGPNYDEYKAKEQKIAELKALKEEHAEALTVIRESLSNLNAEKESIDTQRREHEMQRQGVEKIMTSVSQMLKAENYLRDLEDAEPVKNKISDPNTSHVNDIQNLINQIKADKEIVKLGIKKMVDKDIISDPNNLLMNSDQNYNQIHEALYKRLVALYQELEEEKRLLTDQIRTHTDMTIEISEVLESQMRHYSGMVQKLNQTLARFNITNIDEMRLSMSMSETVKSFVKQINSSGLQGTDTDMTSANTIFEYVRKFISAMNIAESKAFSLSAEDVIDGIELQFLVGGKWTTTTGSNGQTLVSTAVLLSLFIEHICGQGVILSIPINVDEISAVDQNNLKQLADFIASKKLVLFSASPEISFGHDGIFKNYISFDDSKVYDPDIILAPTHYVVMHHFFGGMYQPEVFDEDMDMDDALTGEVTA